MKGLIMVTRSCLDINIYSQSLKLTESRPDSSIRNQAPRNHSAPKLLIQHIKIQIHKLVLSHKVRDAPDRRAPLHPRNRILHLAWVHD